MIFISKRTVRFDKESYQAIGCAVKVSYIGDRFDLIIAPGNQTKVDNLRTMAPVDLIMGKYEPTIERLAGVNVLRIKNSLCREFVLQALVPLRYTYLK